MLPGKRFQIVTIVVTLWILLLIAILFRPPAQFGVLPAKAQVNANLTDPSWHQGRAPLVDHRVDARTLITRDELSPNLVPYAPATATAIVDWAFNQTQPAIAYNTTAGAYLVVWQHEWAVGASSTINGRMIAADGAPAGQVFGISAEPDNCLAPDIAYNAATGEYLVVWEYAFDVDRDDYDIYGQRVSSSGVLLGNRIAIVTSGDHEGRPAVAYNSVANEYLVAWENQTDGKIYGVRLGTTGITIGNAAVIGASPGNAAAAPDLAYSATSDLYLLVWHGKNAGGDYEAYGQRVHPLLPLLGNAINLSNWSGNQWNPRLAYHPQRDEFLIFWQDYHWDLFKAQIYGQRLQANGALIGGAVTVANQSAVDNRNPDVIYQPSARGYLLVWEYAQSSTNYDIYQLLYSGDAQRLDGPSALTAGSANENQPVLASDSANGVEIVWEDNRNSAASGVDLYGDHKAVQLLTFTGAVYAGNSGDTSTPLSNVTVNLGCSNNANSTGTLIASSSTNAQGVFTLPVYHVCEFYHLLETDLADYVSISASSPGGTIVTSNWIRYSYPLAGKILTDNNFWDYRPGPIDTVPPSNWTNFAPNGWVNTQNVACSVQVEDTLSGLDVLTAQVAYSRDAGSTWSAWQPATCSGQRGTTSPQIISIANVPFGQDTSSHNLNQCKFRIADVAGNGGESGAYPVLIDTGLPQNPPSITCPLHLPATWSTVSQVTCAWSGASDDLSGVAGYTLDWDQAASSVPALPLETAATEDSLPLSDSNSWYLHVRAVDRAGNGAVGATHYGPIYIDTQWPSAWLTAPGSGAVNARTFTVAWNGQDVPSGIASYDVQTSPDGTTWSDWHMGVSAQTALFTGEPAQTYFFRVRARDQAGIVSAWSTAMKVTVGVEITVRVRNEDGVNLPNAKVYHNAKYSGVTNAVGAVTLHNAVIGDTLAALHLAYTEPAAKPNHQWAWHVYQTSISIPNNGTPQLFVVADPATVQDLTVRKDQALIGLHIIVWVEWDASSAFLDDVRQGVQHASAFLYDVTDGQLFWEQIEIIDNGENGKAGDMNIYASNQVWPNAFIGAISNPSFGRIYLPRDFQGNWSNRVAYGTMIHEFGHYGLWLYDEYLDRNGKAGGFCTHNRGANPADEPTRASIMDNSDDASELCSHADAAHLHNTNTEQDSQNKGESTWQTVLRIYTDKTTPTRWTLQSPDTRQVAVVPGPNALPSTDWMSIQVTDRDTQVCAPYAAVLVYAATGAPVEGAEIVLERPADPPINQGLTDKQGELVILGAHPGDTLRAKKDNLSGVTTVTCSPAEATAQFQAAPQTLPIEPEPFALTVNVAPIPGDAVQVQVAAAEELLSAPTVWLWQEGNAEALSVPMAYDSGLGRYTGQAAFSMALERRGYTQVVATSTAGRTVTRGQAFNITPLLAAGASAHLYSSDGNFELVLPVAALTADATLAIQPTTVGSARQGNLVRLGLPYQISISTGQQQLNLPAVVNLHYQPDQMSSLRPGVVQLYRWDAAEQAWVIAGTGVVDTNLHIVSTEVDRLATFALFGQQSPTLYLPLIAR